VPGTQAADREEEAPEAAGLVEVAPVEAAAEAGALAAEAAVAEARAAVDLEVEAPVEAAGEAGALAAVAAVRAAVDLEVRAPVVAVEDLRFPEAAAAVPEGPAADPEEAQAVVGRGADGVRVAEVAAVEE